MKHSPLLLSLFAAVAAQAATSVTIPTSFKWTLKRVNAQVATGVGPSANCWTKAQADAEKRQVSAIYTCYLNSSAEVKYVSSAPAPAPSPTPSPSPSPAPAPSPAPSYIDAFVRYGIEGESFTLTSTTDVRYGDGSNWVTKTASGFVTCGINYFGSDPAYGVAKFCEVKVTVPAVTQVAGARPVINTALIPKPAAGYSTARVRTLSAAELQLPVYQTVPTTVGAFRIPCPYSHMSFNDPIVFPGVPGASHLHTFNGNTLVDAYSTAASLKTSGDSTCAGGILNRTAYWMPTLVDIRTGQPVVPVSTNFYYKLGYLGVVAGTVQPPPAGLRMIAGNSAGTSPITSGNIGLECVSGGGHKSAIPSCAVGDMMNIGILFPQCWDGINLDSPDHKSHMAYATGTGCPVSHPVPIPEIALNVHYMVAEANSGTFWKLSSDAYTGPGGYSAHADWYMAWDTATIQSFVTNCINGNLDCHDNLLGDGRTLY